MMKSHKGFSLLELIATLGCFLVLVLVSMATWRHYAAKLKQDMVVYQMKNGLRYARHEAIAYQAPMVYCGSSDLHHCDGHWHHAEIVKDSQSGAVLRSYVLDTDSLLIDFHGNFGRSAFIEFTPQGMTNGQQGHFTICLPASVLMRNACQQLKVGFSGEVIS